MSNHLKTAHEWGVQQALEKVGYKTAEDVRKEADELGLLEQPKVAAANPLADLFRTAQK
jgi:hypothetical protein